MHTHTHTHHNNIIHNIIIIIIIYIHTYMYVCIYVCMYYVIVVAEVNQLALYAAVAHQGWIQLLCVMVKQNTAKCDN